jgi:hypothetical protein
VIVHVDTVPVRTQPAGCIFQIAAPLREGGTTKTCLTSVDGFPAPRATMHSKGVMTFAWRSGTLRVRVTVTQVFAADGVHAKQSVVGRITGGTGKYAHAHGTLSGGGSVIDRRSGLGRVRLAYKLTIS